MTTLKTTPPTTEAAAKTTTARSTAKTTTARKTPAKAPAEEPRGRKPTADWANLYEYEAAPAPAPAPARLKTPIVEMTVTPVRGFTRPKRHQLSFRLPTDIPALLNEAQQLLFEQGRGQSRDLIVADAIRQWVERERATLARAKAKAKAKE